MLAIQVHQLEKTYTRGWRRPPLRALAGLDLEVPCGLAFGLVGPNGAGKTTFIKTLLGIVRPTGGVVRVLGGDPEDPGVRARIGYLPERLHLPASWTPVAFLASVARLKRASVPRYELTDLLVRVGLGPEAQRKIGGFSKGMKQRLGLAAALLGRPELLILDEPTDGVDPMGRVEIRSLLAQELARGTTVFLNSHLLAETERICARVAVLAAGQAVREGKLEDLCRAEGRWRVRFAPGANAAALTEAGFARPGDSSDSWTFVGADLAAFNQALDRARATGALLVDLRADEKDLEQVLAEAIGYGGAA